MTDENEMKLRNVGPSGPLYDLLMEKMPTLRRLYGGHSRLDVYKLAEAVDTSHQYLYRILSSDDNPSANKVSMKLGRRLIAFSESQGLEKPLTLMDLEPFLPS